MTEVKYLFPHWGSEHLSAREFFSLVVSNNFDGIEINLPKEDFFMSNFLEALLGKRLENHEFILGLQQVFGVVNESADAYLDQVLKRLDS